MRLIITSALAVGLTACASMKKDKTPEYAAGCAPQAFAVFFDTGSSALDAAATNEVNNIASAYQGCDLYRIQVEGYSDSVGSSPVNLKLSDDRATTVLDALNSRGIVSKRATIIPFGELEAQFAESPDAFERRVVVSLIP